MKFESLNLYMNAERFFGLRSLLDGDLFAPRRVTHLGVH